MTRRTKTTKRTTNPKATVARAMIRAVNDSASLDAITELLSGTEWDVDTLQAIADIIRASGRTIRDVEREDTGDRRLGDA